MLKFAYSKSEQNCTEILFSSLKLFLLSLPNTWQSLIFFAFNLTIFSNVHHFAYTDFNYIVVLLLELILYSLSFSLAFLQIQRYADGIKLSLNEFSEICRLKVPLILSTQMIAVLFIACISFITPLFILIFIFPIMFLIPLSLFKSDSILKTFSLAWKYTSGSRFKILVYTLFGLLFLAFINLLIIYLLSAITSQFLQHFIFIILLSMSLLFVGVYLLLMLHNVLIRHQQE